MLKSYDTCLVFVHYCSLYLRELRVWDLQLLFNDTFFLEILILVSVLFYLSSTNITMLLYTGGIYLILIGLLALVNDADIYIGFLWVIDLGVGLVFFIFILHFTSFLFQKSQFNLTARHFLFTYALSAIALVFMYFYATPADNTYYHDLGKAWFFKLSYIDYFDLLFTNEVSDLNTLKDTYFLLNSFEFFIVNFSLFFGLIASILMCFMIQRIFTFLNYSQIINASILSNADTGFFIRNQNFVTQQNTSGTIRVWAKSRSKHRS